MEEEWRRGPTVSYTPKNTERRITLVVSERCYTLGVGNVFFTYDGKLLTFSGAREAKDYLATVQPFPESALRVCDADLRIVLAYAKTCGASLYLDGELLYDPYAPIH